MKKIFIIIILFHICSFPNSQTIPIQINEYGFIIVDVTLNDSVKGKFIFDTGGGLMVVSNKIYKQVESSLISGGYFTGFRHDGDRLSGELMIFPSVTIADYSQKNVYGGIYPPLDEYGIDGIISLKSFEYQAVTVNFRDKTLTIETPENMAEIEKTAEELPIVINSHLDYGLDIFVIVCLNDSIKIKAEFDTGSGFNTLLLNPFLIPSVIPDTTILKSQEYTAPISGNKLTDKTGKINTVSYCGSSILTSNDVNVIFREGIIYEGLIGSGMFRDKILTIDIPNKRLLVRE